METAYLTIPEFCRIYRIGRTLVYREIAAGRLVMTKFGAASRISREHAAAWAARQPTTAAAA